MQSLRRRAIPTALALGTLLSAQAGSITPAPRPLTVTGEVCDLLGSPLVGATIAVRRGDDGAWYRMTTDGIGGFVLQVPMHERIAMRVTAAGHAAWDRILEPDDIGVRADLTEIVLEDGGELTGTVRDPAGRPLQATITAGADECVADAEGRYLLRHVALGPVEVYAYAPGTLVAHAKVDSTATTRHDFTLAPDDGPPVATRLAPGVEVDRVRLEVYAPFLPPALTRLRFDAEGKTTVRGVRDGRVMFRLRDVATGRTLAERTLILDAAGATIELSPDPVVTNPLAGRLRGPDGQPLGGIALTLSYGSSDSATRTTTAADGTFRCQLPTATRPSVFAEIDDPAWVLVIQQRGLPLTPTLPPAPIVELSAVPACTVRGKVLDPDGVTIPFALVNLSAPAGVRGHHPRGRDLHAGPDGTFVFQSLSSAAEDLTLIARAPRYAGRVDEVAIRTPGAQADVTLRLTKGGEVLGVAHDGDGKPIAGAWVRVPREFVARPGVRDVRFVPFAETKTNRAGQFRVRGLPPGRYQLFLAPKPGEAPQATFTIEGGEVKNLDVFTVR